MDPSLELSCSGCGRTYAEWTWRCDCGAPLDFSVPAHEREALPGEPPTTLPADPTASLAEESSTSSPVKSPNAWASTAAGLWSFRGLLPVESRVTLGEGATPLVEAPEWDAAFKLEYVFPTGSFKDRGATVTLSVAAELGIDRVVEDSSGNAGAAIATYAARAGIDAEIYVPAAVKPSKRRAIERTGATVVPVEGTREDVTAACVAAVESGDAWYASHAWNPAFFAGTATFAYEVCAQRGWNAPDAVVAPLGHGTLFLGAYRGFRDLYELGWIDDLPRLLGAQAAGYAPVVAELHGRDAAAGSNDVADGIQIREPVRKRQILDAIDATDGDAVALPADRVERELDALHRRGFYVEPTCAVAPAALDEYRTRGVVDPDGDVVVALTGSGLKT
ncbi:pyridoxal-phosphate dependent enzyme [Halobellus rufus]|uniref:pyridoxal-phosphate dependent enzyme n=1 Tax=Halobellus rufus TaxID=1448860 RepID=UPI000678D265|nr:pyridoxal-phosphate dependent enzyme [Halobellus rufus]